MCAGSKPALNAVVNRAISVLTSLPISRFCAFRVNLKCSTWNPIWACGRARRQVADRSGNLVACDFGYDGCADSHTG
jgi:hypothetical protein